MDTMSNWQKEALNCTEWFGCCPEFGGWISTEWDTSVQMTAPLPSWCSLRSAKP